MNNVLFHAILLAYLLASLLFWLSISLRQYWTFRSARLFLGGGFCLQTVFLGYSLYEHTFPWWEGATSALGLLSWAIVAAYLTTVWRYNIEALGAFLVPLAFVTAASAGIPVSSPERFPVAVQYIWLSMHIVLALLGYAALTLTFCAGIMYVIQERQLKSKRPGTWYHHLPSLTLLDDLNARALLLGFPLLTQGIITGSIWAKYVHGSYFQWSLTSLPLLVAWLMYAVLLGGRRVLGWRGGKAARATIGGFVLILASYFVHTL